MIRRRDEHDFEAIYVVGCPSTTWATLTLADHAGPERIRFTGSSRLDARASALGPEIGE